MTMCKIHAGIRHVIVSVPLRIITVSAGLIRLRNQYFLNTMLLYTMLNSSLKIQLESAILATPSIRIMTSLHKVWNEITTGMILT